MPPEKNESTRIYLFRAMALSLTAMKYCDTHWYTYCNENNYRSFGSHQSLQQVPFVYILI